MIQDWVLAIKRKIIEMGELNPNQKVLYDYAFQHVGVPYLWTGSNAVSGFDCSGYVSELLKSSGVVTRRLGSVELHDTFRGNPVASASFGCLAFYGKPGIDHVAFCLNDFFVIQAASGDSTTINKEIAAKQGACVKVRPLKYRNDLVVILKPTYPWETK